MRSKLILLFAFILIMPIAYSLTFYDSDCYDDGHVTFTVMANNESKAYTKDIKVISDGNLINGDWSAIFLEKTDIKNRKYGTFTSKEASFNAEKTYDITLDYILIENITSQYKETLNFQVKCPGILFSCSLLNLTIDDCYAEDGKFTAAITAAGLKQSKRSETDANKALSFNIKSENNYLDKKKVYSDDGDLPLDYSISYLKNDQYILQFDFKDNFVKSMFVEFNDNIFAPCSWEKYSDVKHYDLKECSAKTKETNQQTETSNQAEESQNEEKQKQGNEENMSNATAAAQKSEEEINSKSIIMLTVIFVIVGIAIIALLKRREITS